MNSLNTEQIVPNSYSLEVVLYLHNYHKIMLCSLLVGLLVSDDGSITSRSLQRPPVAPSNECEYIATQRNLSDTCTHAFTHLYACLWHYANAKPDFTRLKQTRSGSAFFHGANHISDTVVESLHPIIRAVPVAPRACKLAIV